MTKEEQLKKKLDNEASLYCQEYATLETYDSVHRAYIFSAEPREKRIAELEKENAELKGLKDVATLIRANNDTVITLMQLNNKLVSKNQQLTKAKELLKEFNLVLKERGLYHNGLYKRTEQFLNSEVDK